MPVARIDARDFRTEIISLFEANGRAEFVTQFDWYYRNNGQQKYRNLSLRGSVYHSASCRGVSPGVGSQE